MQTNEDQSGIESVTISDLLSLDTWNRPRSSEELKGFISTLEQR